MWHVSSKDLLVGARFTNTCLCLLTVSPYLSNQSVMIQSAPTEMEETEEFSTSGKCFWILNISKSSKLDLLLIKTSAVVSEWRIVSDPKNAGWLFSQELLHSYKDSGSLSLNLDLRHSREEQDRAIVSFYKRDGVHWASPFTCMLKGRLKNAVWISNMISSVYMKCEFTGDVATGSGVDRHIISTVISRLISGLQTNLGKIDQRVCVCVCSAEARKHMISNG